MIIKKFGDYLYITFSNRELFWTYQYEVYFNSVSGNTQIKKYYYKELCEFSPKEYRLILKKIADVIGDLKIFHEKMAFSLSEYEKVIG